ncbi:MAG: HAMP domain-containing histidine kinase, partial [Clostridiales bacterium]|nr:HAMP domain-containing histidine kinase [Clostridiales bacterium]
DESVRLTKLIRELLDLAQIDSGQFPLNIQRFEVNELIRRVLARFVDRIEERGVELAVDFRPEQSYVMADADRIEQVVVNLLDNAIKFVDEGGQIRLWTFKSEDKVLVCVGNSGGVIPEEDLPYVFERFYKVDKSHSGRRGTGLGLSIVRRILEQHGQTVTAHSKSGSTTFTFGLARSPDQTNK